VSRPAGFCRVTAIVAFAATALWAPATELPRVSRADLSAMERSFNERIIKLNVEQPFDLLGTTRGVYLDGYGAIFTAEVNLLITPTITPFLMSMPKEQVVRVHQRKLERLPVLKRAMRDMLVASAASLDTVPPDEQIVVGVTLFYYSSWEDRSGLPSQVVMQAQRKALLDFQARRINDDALKAAIRVQEL
jgi:hypothetical protein